MLTAPLLVFTSPAFLSGGNATQAGFLLIVAVVTGLVLLSTRRKIHEAFNRPKTYARDLQRRLTQEKDAIGNIQEVMFQLERLARDLNGQLDTRHAKLETAIRDADQRIETLAEMLGQNRRLPVSGKHPARERPPGDIEKSSSPRTTEELKSTVRRLAQAGLNSRQIAEHTDRPQGEVELILSLQNYTPTSALAPP